MSATCDGLVIWDCTRCGTKGLRTAPIVSETWCPCCHVDHSVIRRVSDGAWSVVPSSSLEIVGRATDGTPIARGHVSAVEAKGVVVA